MGNGYALKRKSKIGIIMTFRRGFGVLAMKRAIKKGYSTGFSGICVRKKNSW